MRRHLFLFTFVVFSTASGAESAPQQPPAGDCVCGPLILVRGLPQHAAQTQAAVREFLKRAPGNPEETTPDLFKLRTPTVFLHTLKFLPDASGGLILPQVPCANRGHLGDAESKQYMLALLAKLQSERTVPAEAQLIDVAKVLEEMQSTPTSPASEDGGADTSR